MTRVVLLAVALALGAAAVALAACHRSPPTIYSCADPLGGVWHDSAGRGFHILDHGNEVDVYPMWDTTAPGQPPPLGAASAKPPLTADPPATPVLSPLRILLHERGPRAVTGTVSLRVDKCTVTARARLSDCHGRAADLAIEEEPAVNPLTCESPGPTDRWIDVPLRRE